VTPVETSWWRVALDLLDHWQTLIAGVLAFAAGFGTVVATMIIARRQITASRKEAEMVIAATREQTETTVRLERMRDAGKSAAAALDLQSAVHRCMSVIQGKRKLEIWPTYTDVWNYQSRFRSAYAVAAMGRSELFPNVLPDQVGKLLDRLREVGRSVDDGREPDEGELKDIAAALGRIVRDLHDSIGPPR
jgi:hypothetical protein